MRPAVTQRALRRLVSVATVAAAAGLMSAAPAGAQFTIAACSGSPIAGRGASFQTNAINGLRTAFLSSLAPGCGASAPDIEFDPAGSGAGKAALGFRNASNPTGRRDPAIRFGGTDEPLTATERQHIERGIVDANGVDVTAADDNPVHLIPIAIGSVAVMVHLPDGCDYSGAVNKPLDGSRPAIDNETLEAFFAGENSADTWGELIDGVDGTCAAKPAKRYVRQDSSGTTFAFKQLLARINPSRGWAGLGNQAWPDLAGHPVYRPTASGGGNLRTLLAAGTGGNVDNGSGTTTATIDFGAEGGIAYADLATARAGGGVFLWADADTDTTFWLPLQRGTAVDPTAGSTYDDPQGAAFGYKVSVSTGPNPPRGANCLAVEPRGVPATPAANPTLGDWTQVDATATGDGYAGCALTYDMAFDDYAVVYCNSAEEERKARTVKDFLTLAVSPLGQGSLPANDYDRLPTNVHQIAVNAVASIGWKKNGSPGTPCPGDPGPDPTPTPTPTPPPGGGDPPPPPPPPPPISNTFTVSSARVSGTSIRVALQLPGAGRVSIASSTKPKKGKTIKLSTKTANPRGAGAQRITVTLSAKAKSALRKDKRLKVTLRITYTPTGGTARTITRSVTVKQAAKKK